MINSGHPILEEELDEIMEEYDIEREGIISFEEFSEMMIDNVDVEKLNLLNYSYFRIRRKEFAVIWKINEF